MSFSSVCIQAMNVQEPALDLPSVNESWIGIMGGCGSNRNPGKDQPSALPFPSDEQTGERRRILIVEDNAADVYLIRDAIKGANLVADVEVVTDGEQAIRFFDDVDGQDAALAPILVILDINLPRKHGGEVLAYMRQSRRCCNALVIAVSTSDGARDRESMAKLGAKEYFHKPSNYEEFMKLGDIVKALLSSVSPPAPKPTEEC